MSKEKQTCKLVLNLNVILGLLKYSIKFKKTACNKKNQSLHEVLGILIITVEVTNFYFLTSPTKKSIENCMSVFLHVKVNKAIFIEKPKTKRGRDALSSLCLLLKLP